MSSGLSICLSVWWSLYQQPGLFSLMHVCLSLFSDPPVCPSVCPSVCRPVHISAGLLVWWSVYCQPCLCALIYVCLSVCLVCHPVCLPALMSVGPYRFLSVCLVVCWSVYPQPWLSALIHVLLVFVPLSPALIIQEETVKYFSQNMHRYPDKPKKVKVSTIHLFKNH